MFIMACKHQIKRWSFKKWRKNFRYVNHKKTFNNIKYQTHIKLSNGYWNIRSVNKNSNISWKILGTHNSWNQSSKRCLLCLNEKLASNHSMKSIHIRIYSGPYFPYSVRMRENTDQKNSKYGQFLRSESLYTKTITC